MLLQPNYASIIEKIPNSRIGLERRCTFALFQYNFAERFLSIDFRIEYGATHKHLNENEEEVEYWEAFANPTAGIKPYTDTFVANDSIVVDMQGNVVKKVGEDATVDLDDPETMYIGQFGYFYEMAKGHPVIIEELVRAFIQNAINNGQFIDV